MKVKELNIKPHLYLDMDGVQCDFYQGVADLFGYTSYKDIPNPEELITELANSNPKQVFDFFANLEILPGGLKLLNYLKVNKIPFTILSAPLRGPYSKYSILGKKEWLNKYNPGASKNAIFTSEKYLYAQKNDRPNVLVDDLDKNINQWRAKGGIPIKHLDSTIDNTIKELEKIYSPYK